MIAMVSTIANAGDTLETEELPADIISRLQNENANLRYRLERKNEYIRRKTNHLLDMMGTMPLKTEELDDDMLIDFDPLGIICDSFKHILANLNNTNKLLHNANEETKVIFDTAEVGILHIDKDMKVLSFNSKLKELFMDGVDENDIIGHTCHDRVCNGEVPEEGCSFHQIIHGGGISRLKNWAFRGRIFDVTGNPILNNNGALESVVLVYHDVTERIKAEEQRQENLLFIKELLKNAPLGIRVFDGESGDCILLNQVAVDIAGGDASTMQQQNFRKLTSWQKSGLLEVSESVLEDGVPRVATPDMITSFGKEVTVEYLVSKFSAKGKRHLLVIGRDVTLEKQLAEKNRKIEAQMLHAQKLESLGVLAGGIAHDFNNILLAIIGNAELALMRLIPESPIRNNLHQIEKAAQRAAALAQQMLAYSGKGHFVIEPLDVNALIHEMNQILEVSISKKAAIRLNLTDQIPLFDGDATQIRQIIMNLVINASEAIGEENGVITVTTGVMNCDHGYLSSIWAYDKLPEGSYLYFEIADTGCGMEKEIVAKIFEPFFTTKFTGRGLGMAAVLGIIRGHGGAITIYSEPGKGTNFKVLLPISKSGASSLAGRVAKTTPSTTSATVLLVDDEEAILSIGKEMLEFLGYTVLTAENGAVAVECFKKHQNEIACVILDLTMPCLDGEQTLRELKKLSANVRVIISSGFNEQEVTRQFYGKGLAGFIQKPYKLEELQRKLQQAISDK